MISTSHSYAAFQRRLDGIFSGSRQRPQGFLGYTQNEVASRLIQRCAELGVFEFTRIAAEIYRTTGSLPADEAQVVCGGVLIDAEGGIRLAPGKFLKLLAECLAHWGYTFAMILISLRLFGARKQVTLLYGVGLHDLLADGSDARFLNFCRAGPIHPLAEAGHLLIQAMQSIDSTEPARVQFGRNPLLQAVRWSGLGFCAWLYALGQHFLAAVSFARAACISPALMLLGRDVANHAAAAALNRDGNIRDVVFTTSNYFSQPLWFWALPQRSYTSHIVWYSHNNYPISYVDEPSAVPFPNLRYIKADVQWVWSEGFRDFLSGLCTACAYRVVGPVVWHLRSRMVETKGKAKRIALFDVTPISEEVERKFGLLRNLYSEKNVSAFIQDVVDVARAVGQEIGAEIEVVLKHKRPHHSIHSSEYIQTIASLADDCAIKLINPTSNLYDLILGSDLVIACPYSSPVYIGRDAEKAAFWYDPTSTLEWKLGEPEFPLIQGREQLAATIRKALG